MVEMEPPFSLEAVKSRIEELSKLRKGGDARVLEVTEKLFEALDFSGLPYLFYIYPNTSTLNGIVCESAYTHFLGHKRHRETLYIEIIIDTINEGDGVVAIHLSFDLYCNETLARCVEWEDYEEIIISSGDLIEKTIRVLSAWNERFQNKTPFP